MNPYLLALRAKYKALQDSVTGLQTRAHTEKRELNDNEKELVRKQDEEMKSLLGEIETLTEIEVRNAKVAAFGEQVRASMAGVSNAEVVDLTGEDTDGADGETRVGGATTNDRDPGHYTRSSKRSFFGDLLKAGESNDRAAARRLGEHNAFQSRAAGLTTTDNGPGIVPPKWLMDEFAETARQGRAVANAVRNVPLGNDPRPLTLPKQTAGTDNVVAEQALENDAVSETDAYDTDTDIVTPKPTSGAQKVSRQMLDMASPAIDSLIYADMIAVYNLKVEKKVCAAITAAGTAGGGTALSGLEEVAITDIHHYSRTARRAGTAVRKARKLAANILVMSVDRNGEFIDLRDTTGRPLVPEDSSGPMNVLGVGSINVDGRYRGLAMIATEGILVDNQFAAVRSSDVLLFESDMLRFKYEQVYGPQAVKMGIWAYTAVLVRYGNAPVKLVNVTDWDGS